MEDFQRLPEGCLSHIVSLTSPRDACTSALVSPFFRSAAESDFVWERFLPPDCAEILSRVVDPLLFPSKRDLFLRLCDPILIEGGKMGFFLERSSGRKCFMISARSLSISWGDTPQYWRWFHHPSAMFSEVAELLNVCWLEIRGKMDSKLLSLNTKYGAYLVYSVAPESRGLGFPYQVTSVKLGAQKSIYRVGVLQDDAQPNNGRHDSLPRRRRPLRATVITYTTRKVPGAEPRERDDGWMEIELGEFQNGSGEDGEVEMSFTEVKGGHWKSGLIVHCMELRPKDQ